MGKDKRKRNKRHRENPTGLASNKHFDETEDSTKDSTDFDKKKALQIVYEEIQSSVIEEKLSGLQTLESMSYGKDMAERISSDGIVKMIGPLLIDHSLKVRAACASALRHIVENGKDNIVTKFIDDDIMTPLSILFIRDYKEWRPKLDSTVKEELRDEKETFIEAVTLLLTLCERNEVAVKHVNKLCPLSILLQYLNVTIYGIEITTVVAQFILTLSEDNPIAIETLKEYKQDLFSLLNLEVSNNLPFNDLILLKTLIIGILLNMHCLTKSNEIDAFYQVMKILLETLTLDNSSLLHDLYTILSTENENLSKETRKKIQEFRKLLGAQQQTLEIFANICTDEEENELLPDLDNFNEMDLNESMDEDESEETDLTNNISSLSVEIIKTITNCNVLQQVWVKTANIDKKIHECFSKSVEGRELLIQIDILRCRAYLCANNLLFILDISSANDMDYLYNIWCQIGKIVFGYGEDDGFELETNFELLDSAIAAMRASLQKLAKAPKNYFSNLTVDDISIMFNCDELFLNTNIGVNLIRIFGQLALIIAQSDNQHKYDLLKNISMFLLVTCKEESSAWINAECLDAVMDIFSDDETDQLAKELNLINTLSHLIPAFKEKVHQQKHLLRDKSDIISTVNNNIRRFMKYKKKRVKLLQ